MSTFLGPSIVHDISLVAEYDAADKNSYVSGSTSWYDLSGNNNTGVLTNNPTYSGSNGGYIAFNGSNSCIVINSNALILSTVAYTKMTWFYTTNLGLSNNLIAGGNSTQHTFWLFSGNKLNSGHNGSWNTVVGATTLSTNTWYHAAVTFNTTTGWVLYLNGQQDGSNASTTTFLTTGGGTATGGEILLGCYSTGVNAFGGGMSCAQVYNRLLTATEILNNYNTQKARFGL
jgi:hypothetical protein